MEQGPPDPLVHRKGGILKPEEVQGGEQKQYSRGDQDHFRLHPVALEPEPVEPDVLPGQKADTAGNNQHHDYEIDGRLDRKAGQGRELRPVPHQVEPGVAERGDRMKQAVPKALAQAEFPAEHRGQGGGSQQLNAGCRQQDEPGQPHDAPDFVGGDGVLHRPPLAQGDGLARRRRN